MPNCLPELTPAQRRRELASILARGVIRWHRRAKTAGLIDAQKSPPSKETPLGLPGETGLSVGTFTPDRVNQTLSNRVLPARAWRGWRLQYAQAFGYTVSMNTQRLCLNCVLFFTTALVLSLPLGACAQTVHRDQTPGRVVLFNGRNLDGWKLRNEAHKDSWKVVSQVAIDKSDPKQLVGTGEGGTHDAVLFRAPVAHGSDLLTEESFGDCRLHIELMVPKGSNSGVYLMGRYEVQVFDSFGKPDDEVTHSDMGGIYSVKAPTTNAAKAPGEWQSLDIIFRAPRFDAAGR